MKALNSWVRNIVFNSIITKHFVRVKVSGCDINLIQTKYSHLISNTFFKEI
jgi:hypothetical protein